MAGASSVGVSRSGAPLLQLDGRPTTRVGLLGIFERGPIGVATECASYTQFQQLFGGFTASAQQGPLAAKLAFEESKDPDRPTANANVILEVVRVVHSATPADISTKTSAAAGVTLATAALAETAASVTGSVVGPFALSNGLTLIVDVDGAGDDTATFNATAASRTSTTGTYNLTNGQTLTFSINGGTVRTATFLTANFVDITAATPQEVVNVLNAKIAEFDMGGLATVSANAVKLTSNVLGTGSAVNVTGGTANSALSFTTGSVSGTGDAVNAAAVTVAELKTLIEGDIAGVTVSNVGGAVSLTSDTTGSSSSIQVNASSTMEAILGLDTAEHVGTTGGAVSTLGIAATSDGAWGNSFSVKIAAASNGDADEFDLQVLKGSIVQEAFINLSMTDTDPNYVETVVNEGGAGQAASLYIRATDLDAAVTSPDDKPATGTFALTSGADGLTSIADADFVGGLNSSGKTAGLSAFDRRQVIDVFIAPDRTTASFHNSLNTYNNGRKFPAHIEYEPPAGQSYAQIRTYVKSTAQLRGLSERASISWPRTFVDNPDTAVFGNAKTVRGPISGQIAGLYARVDASRIGGASISPAGTSLRLYTARSLETDDVRDATIRGLVFDDLINPITYVEVGPNAGAIYVDGARCLKSDGPFPTKGQSRGVGYLERQLGIALDPQRHKGNTEALRAAIAGRGGELDVFLKLLADNDFFTTRDYALAFRLNGGKALNPLAEQAARRANIGVGVAMAFPGEFWNLNFYPFNG